MCILLINQFSFHRLKKKVSNFPELLILIYDGYYDGTKINDQTFLLYSP